jgi:oligopeptide transport system substrate-binding protein
MENATYMAWRRTPAMQITRTGWVMDFMDPQNMLDILITDGGSNHAHYSDAEYDRLVRLTATMPDGAERNALMRQAEDIAITRDQALIPLFYYVNQDLINLDVWEGWYSNTMGLHPYVGMRRR